MKKIILLIIVLSFMAIVRAHAYDFSAINDEGNILFYNLNSDGLSVSVTKDGFDFLPYKGKVIIPPTVVNNGKTYTVTAIDDNAFVNCSNITELSLPNSLTSIGNAAFTYCGSLTEVTIPNSVVTLGNYAFSWCPKLKSFHGKYASEDNKCLIVDGVLNSFAPSGLSFYAIPNSVNTIGDYAFSGCEELLEVNISSSVNTIKSNAFSGCVNLIEVVIPDSAISIENNAFLQTGLYNNSSYWSDGVLYLGQHLIRAKPKLSGDYKIRNGTLTIADKAFYRCNNLTSADIPSSILYIGNGAFLDCEKLEAFYGKYASEDNRCLIMDGNLHAFAPYGIREYIIPPSVKNICDESFYNCRYLNSVTIPNTVTVIGNNAFRFCGILNIDLPSSVTSIGDYAFAGCSALGRVYLPNSVSTIGKYAFSDCSGMTDLTIPGSVIEIGNYAFSRCMSLMEVNIPNSITTLGIAVFSSCPKMRCFYGKFASEDNKCLIVDGVLNSFAPFELTNYSIPDGIVAIGDSSFAECEEMTEVNIPSSVSSIGDSAFIGCSTFTSITIPESVVYIGENTFSLCKSIASINIPNSVTKIGPYAFNCCYSLASVNMPNDIKEISNGIFCGCHALQSVEIPCSVTSIRSSAFSDCGSLYKIVIPGSVMEIGNSAFYNCYELNSLKVNNSNPNSIYLGSMVFNNVPTSLCALYVPKGSKELYENAEQWRDFTNIVEFTADDSLTPYVNIDSCISGKVYDLMGRETANPAHGLFIKDGRKILLK